MSLDTGIQWTDATWNPIRGCSLVSEGCRNCYAMHVAARFSGPGLAYEGLARRRSSGEPQWTGEVRVIEKHMADPIRWQRPRKIFVNSMSDLFHENVSDETIARVFAVMAIARHQTFQLLTKRPSRMLAWLAERDRLEDIYAHWSSFSGDAEEVEAWPLPNVWLGVSVENQATAEERIPLLLNTPAAIRFLSCEPLLGPVDLLRTPRPGTHHDWLTGEKADARSQSHGAHIDWVIVGGESGPHARPCDVRWLRSIVQQCRAGGVAPFVKQLGALVVDNELDLGRAPDRAEASRVRRAWGFDHTDGLPNVVDLHDSHGGDMNEWPEDLRVREFPRGA